MMMQQEVTKLARYSAINVGILPRLPGVEPLSVHEIHSDLCELQRIMSPTNTDSDSSSVESDEVLDSHYPVKPRRTIRTYEREEIVPELERPETSPEVEEALKMLHLMSHANRDVFDLEAEREELEGTCESYKLRTLRNSALYKEAKSAHEAYLRVLQGILIRTLQIQHSQQHLLHHLSAVQSALKGWRQYSEHLTHLSHLSSSSSTTTSSTQTARKAQLIKGKTPASSYDLSAAILCLSPSSDDMPIPLLISNGSKVQTAYGPAFVNNWNINTGTATLQLPYGAMTASLITVRDWCHDEIQRLLLSSLCQTNKKEVFFDNRDYLSSSVLSLSAQQPGGVISSDEEDKESNHTDTLAIAAGTSTHAEATDDDRRPLLYTETIRKDLLRPAFLAALAPDADALNELASLATSQNKRINLSSLQGEPRYPHSGDGQPVSRLRADLNKLKNEQQGLATLRNQLEQQLVNRRREIARISMASAALRLRMFTRRYCHRSSLAAKGVPLPPQPVQVYVAHHAKPASLPRALKEVMSMNLANSNNNGGGEGMMGALAMAADLHRNIRPSAAPNASQGATDDLNQSVGQRRARRQLVTHDDSAMDDDDSAVGAVTHKKRVRDEDGTSNNNPRKK